MEMRLAVDRAGRRSPGAVAAVALLCVVLSYVPARAETILLLRGNGREFLEFVRGFADELGGDFKIAHAVVDSSSTPATLAGIMEDAKPRMVVLLDNKAIGLYRNYVKASGRTEIPVLATMGVFIENAISGLPNATGISYEVPIVTSVVSLRSTLKTPVKRVGIIHRPAMAGFVAQEASFCARENIELIASEIPERHRSAPSTIRRSLKRLIVSDKVDALWVPNDIVLLRPETIRDVWVPLVTKYKKPVIVGVESLVNPKLGFGMLSVLPDHVALGSQAAQVVLDTRDAGWKIEKAGVERPLSIFKVINLPRARELVGTGELNTSTIDKILE